MWTLAITVLVWWAANALTSIASKSAVSGGGAGDGDTASRTVEWDLAFKDLRWLELTFLQHLVGGIVAVVWLKAVLRAPLHPASASKKVILMASIGNAVGNLATNAAYAMISSSATQVIKACEPLFTLMLSLVLYKSQTLFDGYAKLVSIPVMISGACVFVLKDTSFNVSGLAAAVTSNFAFPIRNIFVKKMFAKNSWKNSLQNYAVVSVYSVAMLAPFLVAKLALTNALFTIRLNGAAISVLFHSTYNLASIAVLQEVTPLTHAIFNLSKRVFVIVANIAYFHTPLSASMLGGLLVFFTGLALYQTASKTHFSSWKLKTVLITIVTAVVILLASENFAIGRHLIQAGKLKNSPQYRISTAWVFDGETPANVLENIQHLSAHNSIPIHVYCGTSQCLKAVARLNASDITSEFLVVSDIARGTPIEHWFARNPINKIFAGAQFEDHLQFAVQLGILWSKGGVSFDPRVRVMGSLPHHPFEGSWLSSEEGERAGTLLDICYFPRHHPFIRELAVNFASEYPRVVRKNVAFAFDFPEVVRRAYKSSISEEPALLPLEREISSVSKGKVKTHYGTLSYDAKMRTVKNTNLGDEVQSFPGLQFLPFIDYFVDREKLGLSAGNDNITTFFNAWWGKGITTWPPPANIKPVMLSVHIDSHARTRWANNTKYLETKAPIGCRDIDTLQFLKSLDIEAYFSGCLTLLMRSPFVNDWRNNAILLADVKKDFKAILPLEVQENALTVTHNMKVTKANRDHFTSFTAAYKLMEKYAKAKLVVTQRIHCALPCVAMGTPVIFINSPKMPGGGGSKNESTSRTTGLTEMFHTVDLYTMTMGEAKKWLHDFPWNDPPPNPNVAMVMRLKATAWNVIRQDQALYDASRKFGLLPLSPPAPPSSNQLLFHLIFTSSDDFNWRQWRSIESIFHHHPFAKVIVHSNTLPQSEFAVLTEVGYSLEVQPFSIEKLLTGSPAENFTKNFQDFESGKSWDSHQTDLLRFLILYTWGGVYMDTDVIMVRPVSLLQSNAIGWQDPRNESLNGAFMRFEKGSSFVKACLREFADRYNGDLEGYDGPGLLSRVWKRSFTKSSEVHVLDSTAFYMFNFSEVKSKCFFDDSKDNVSQYMTTLREKAFAVQLNSKVTAYLGVRKKLKKDTLCKHLLNSFCVLCNKQY